MQKNAQNTKIYSKDYWFFTVTLYLPAWNAERINQSDTRAWNRTQWEYIQLRLEKFNLNTVKGFIDRTFYISHGYQKLRSCTLFLCLFGSMNGFSSLWLYCRYQINFLLIAMECTGNFLTWTDSSVLKRPFRFYLPGTRF